MRNTILVENPHMNGCAVAVAYELICKTISSKMHCRIREWYSVLEFNCFELIYLFWFDFDKIPKSALNWTARMKISLWIRFETQMSRLWSQTFVSWLRLPHHIWHYSNITAVHEQVPHNKRMHRCKRRLRLICQLWNSLTISAGFVAPAKWNIKYSVKRSSNFNIAQARILF